MKNVEVGDVVVPSGDRQLICGYGWYSHAICVSVDPFILVSDQGDMRWNTFNKNDVIPLCKADASIIKRAMDRIDIDKAKEFSPDAFYQQLKLDRLENETESLSKLVKYVEENIASEDLLSVDRLLFIFDPADFVDSYLPIALLRSTSRLQHHMVLVHWVACRDRIWHALESKPNRKRMMVGLLKGLDV